MPQLIRLDSLCELRQKRIAVDRIYLFTWNLRGSTEAYNLAVDHLAQRGTVGPFIACFQELPGDSATARARSPASARDSGASVYANQRKDALADLDGRGIKVVETPTLPRGLALVHHPVLRVQGNPVVDVDTEFIAAVLQMPASRKQIRVVGVHVWSKLKMQRPEDQGGARALLRQSINELRLGSDHVVLLGDFNSEVGAQEMKSWHGFYVLSSSKHTPHSEIGLSKRRGLDHPAFYAVMPTNGSGMGTFRYRDTGLNEHQIVDFIAVDKVSRENARSEILTTVSAQAVWDFTENSPLYSDHLPVEGTVDI